MSDDFNTAKTLAVLFEMAGRINDMQTGNIKPDTISSKTFSDFKQTYLGFMEDVLGLQPEESSDHDLLDNVMNVLINLRKKARTDKDFALSDKIRDDLKAKGIQLKDGKDGEMTYSVD